MAVIREVSEVLASVPVVEGAGIHARRAFGMEHYARTDPFLQLDDLSSSSPADYLPGYPWHPHRGMETITYVLAGSMTYADSLGNRGVTPAGEIQWMTAGSGVVHQEMPRGDRRGRLVALQLWTNLPARNKMRPPRYVEIVRQEIPVVTLPSGARVLVISGRVGESEGPVPDLATTPLFLDIALPAGAAAELTVQQGLTVIAYVLAGGLVPAPDADAVPAHSAVLYVHRGDTLALSGGPKDSRVLVIGGYPLEEPMVSQGPIVMNTHAELDAALRELQEGTFVKDFAAVSEVDAID